MEFVDEDMRAPATLPVERDAVEHCVRDDQQSRGFELLAEIMDVEHHHALIQIHISGMAENVQRTGRIELQRESNVLRFRSGCTSSFSRSAESVGMMPVSAAS